jgi:hypothetical protein
MHVTEWHIVRQDVSLCHVHFSTSQPNSKTLKYVYRNKAAVTPVRVIILTTCDTKQDYVIQSVTHLFGGQS